MFVVVSSVVLKELAFEHVACQSSEGIYTTIARSGVLPQICEEPEVNVDVLGGRSATR